MYTEETVLNFGKYKNQKIKDIPASYFVNFYKTARDQHPELKEYLEANADKIPGIGSVFYINNFIKKKEIVQFICNKRTFATKKDAMNSIVKPASKSKKGGKVPIRAYECHICSGWHLTSQQDKRFNN